jgi:hypothetical protein
MEQRPTLEDNRSSDIQEIPCILWNPIGSIPLVQMHPTCPYPDPD